MPNCRRTANHVFLFFFSIVLSACTGIATAQPFTQTPLSPKQFTAEKKTPAKVTSTPIPSPTYTSTIKPTGTPTFLPHYSDTPAVSQRTNTPTVTTQTMLTEQALALQETRIAGFSTTCDDSNKYFTSLSPEGNWLAISCGDQTLQIYSKTGKQWVAQFKDYVANQHVIEGSAPRGGLYPMHWTSDEMYLYFTPAINWSIGGTCYYGGVGEGLYRFNLDNGTVVAILPLLKDFDYDISFSPDGRWLIYNRGVPTILNLQTGKEIILPGGENVGDFTWSPDGSNLAYAACQLLDFQTIKNSSIKIFSLETHHSKTILEIESGFLRIDIRDGNRVLKIYDFYTNPPDYLFFDWSTEQLITPTLTPTP